MKRAVFALCLLATPNVLPTPSFAAESPAGPWELDLPRAVALALERNPGVKAAEERAGEVAGGVQEARADAFPQVALVSSWSRSQNPAFLNSPDFEQILEQFPGGNFKPTAQTLSRLSTEVTQAIYTFGKLSAALDLAELAAEVVDAQIESVRQAAALEAAEAFLEVLSAQRAVEVVTAQEKARQSSLEVVEARYEIGEATELERLRARSALAELGPDLASRRGDVEVAESRLRSALGLPAAAELRLRDDPAAGTLAPAPPAAALAEWAKQARPELADLTLQRETLTQRIAVTTAEGRPQIEFTGRYGREAREFENLADNLYSDWGVAVGLRWEFFDGGRRKGQIAQLDSQRRQLAWRLAELENAITLEIETARSSYETARARLAAAEVAASTAREAVRVAGEAYAEGVALQSDLISTQESEVTAEIARVDALFEARKAAVQLERAVGRRPGAGLTAPNQ